MGARHGYNSETDTSEKVAQEVLADAGGGDVDLTPLEDAVDALETSVADQAAELAGKASTASVTALEARPSGIQFPQARGAVVFTWDDGWDTHPGVADMHAARGQAATFYVTADLLDTSQHMATSAVAGINGYAVGHEIGCHSKTHTDMKTLNATTRAEQWASAATLEALMSGKKVRSYAYPLGNNDLTTNQEAYGRFDRVATIALAQGYYSTGSNGYASYLYDQDFEGFRHGRFPWSETTHAQFMLLLKDHVRRRPVILTAYAHQVGAAGTPTLAQVTEALDYCQANGIPCLTTSQAFPGPKLVNPGFEDGLDGWTNLNAGAAVTGTTVDTVTDTAAAGINGTKSLRIISPNTAISADSVHVFQTVPARPLTGYSISARVRHDGTPVGAGKFSVRINEFNSQGGTITARSVRGSASTAAWAQSSAAATTADATNYVAAGHTHPDCRYVTVGLYVQELTGTFYADHVHFGPTEDGLLG
jgi:peptidoglycan/xylan/chitin deacetylase (PgdA/CDA1 family)